MSRDTKKRDAASKIFYRCGDDVGMFWVVVARVLEHARRIMAADEDADLSTWSRWEQLPEAEARRVGVADGEIGHVFRAAW